MDEDSLISGVEVAVTGFAAFCIWLGVRIFNRRERWAKRTAIVLVLAVVFYAFSTGPVYRLRLTYTGDAEWVAYAVTVYCAPVDLAAAFGPEWVGSLFVAYLRWWMPPSFLWRERKLRSIRPLLRMSLRVR